MNMGTFKCQRVQANAYAILQHRAMKIGVNSSLQPGQLLPITLLEVQYKKEHVHV